MRQNTQDIMHRVLKQENKTILKYGLSIDINLNDFDLEKVNLKEENSIINISNVEGIKIKEFKEKSFLIKPKNEFDKFHQLNVKNGLVIEIAPNKTFDAPIQINTKIISKNSLQHIKIIVGKNSKVTFVDIIEDKSSMVGYNSKFVEIITEENSRIDYYHIQNLNAKKIHYSRKIGVTQKNSEINWYDFSIGSDVTVSELSTYLQGEMSRTKVQSIFFADEQQQFDLLGEAVHKAKRTFSKVAAKGAVKEQSKALYKGNVHIEQQAAKSQGFQRADMIMLDNESEADAIPQLLIDNNDVKCSHAVAIGRIDEEKLFYLMSRGITKEEAKNQIVKGFFESAIKDINVEQVSDNLRSIINKKMLK